MSQTKVDALVWKIFSFSSVFVCALFSSSCTFKGEITKLYKLGVETPITYPGLMSKGQFIKASICNNNHSTTDKGYAVDSWCSNTKEQVLTTSNGYSFYQGTTAQLNLTVDK